MTKYEKEIKNTSSVSCVIQMNKSSTCWGVLMEECLQVSSQGELLFPTHLLSFTFSR